MLTVTGLSHWNPVTVRQILMNPVYAGLLRDGEKLIKATHEAIIDRETWEKVQTLQKAKARTHKRGRPSAGKHLFRGGFLKCGICGGSIGPRTHNYKGGVYERYSCFARRNPSACTMCLSHACQTSMTPSMPTSGTWAWIQRPPESNWWSRENKS